MVIDLAGRGYLSLIGDLKRRGYALHIFFLTLASVELALSRIKKRVAKGGHNVPEDDVKRRFDRSIHNFFLHYQLLADSWMLFDNSQRPSIVAFKKEANVRIIRVETYEALISQYGQAD